MDYPMPFKMPFRSSFGHMAVSPLAANQRFLGPSEKRIALLVSASLFDNIVIAPQSVNDGHTGLAIPQNSTFAYLTYYQIGSIIRAAWFVTSTGASADINWIEVLEA